MSSGATPIEYRKLRAPRENGGMLVEPPFDEIRALVERNLRARPAEHDLQGRSLSLLRDQARRELLVGARRWAAEYGNRVPDEPGDSSTPIFLAGHQPELFHPGVWVKNIALAALARRHRAVAVNLLIDGDVAKDLTVRVPGGSAAEPSVEAVPLDATPPKVPYEFRSIVDRRRFAEFGRRVTRRIAPLVSDPLAATYWPLVQERMRQTDNLGACLAQARHQMETQWGVQNLEIPLSRVCETEPFHWFVAHLLAQLPRFQTAYNDAVRAYRRAHRTRSASHPVPDLGADGEWLEAPFWISSADAPVRRPVWVRQRGHRIELQNREGIRFELPLSPERDAQQAVERLMEVAAQRICIRPRALITTLWARLVLGDLFVHGIGGAKYDQVTDVLFQRFFALRPPGFVVLSATLHLPIERPTNDREPPEAVGRELRQLVYHPERFINADNTEQNENDAVLASLLAEKDEWVRTPATEKNARRRCLAIRRINRALQPWVETHREQLIRRQEQAARAQRTEEILRWREYAFCLFPEDTIRDFFRRLLPKDV